MNQHCSVSGPVKYSGELIANGSLLFDPVDAKETQPIGGKIANGKYDIPLDSGLLAGKSGSSDSSAPPTMPWIF